MADTHLAIMDTASPLALSDLFYVLQASSGGDRKTYLQYIIEAATGSPRLANTSSAITSSQPLFNASQNWSNSSVTFTAMKVDITNTASSFVTPSKLIDLQVGGTSMFNVDYMGVATVTTLQMDSANGSWRNGNIALPSDGTVTFSQSASPTILSATNAGLSGSQQNVIGLFGAGGGGCALRLYEMDASMQTAAGTPAANNAYLYLEDNGGTPGKTRLMIRFATGSAIVLATEV